MRHLVEEAGRGRLCFNANLTECENQVCAASLLFSIWHLDYSLPGKGKRKGQR